MDDVRNVLGEARKRDPTTEQAEAEPETGSEPARRTTKRQQEADRGLEIVAAGTTPRKEPGVKQTPV